MPTYGTTQILNQIFDDTNNTLGIHDTHESATAPQAYGTDATGADAYVTVVTASATRRHIYIHNSGTHPAIVSINSGTTDHFFIPGSHAATFDGVLIASGATVQAKNGTAGSNYTGLYITIW